MLPLSQVQNQLAPLHAAIIRDPLVALPDTSVMVAISQMRGVSQFALERSAPAEIATQSSKVHLATRSSCVFGVENSRVVGLLDERDIVSLIAEYQSLAHLTLRQVLQNPVVTVKQSDLTDVLTALSLLRQHQIRYLPILDEQDRFVGFVTHESLMEALNLLQIDKLVETLTAKVKQLELENSALLEKHAIELEQQIGDRTSAIEIELQERKQIETQLRQSEAKNRSLLVAIPDLLLLVGREGSCYEFIPPADAKAGTFIPLRQHLSEVLPPELLQNELQRIEQALATGELQVWEHQILKHGILYDEEVRLVPCGTDECLVVLRDISERKKAERDREQAERQLQQLNQDLEIKVQERTAELQEINEALIRTTRLKDEFLANMSHELRTPLNAILGMTEAMLDEVMGSINPKQIKALQTVERSGTHLLELINEILDLAKMESGQLELRPESTSVAPILQASLTFVRHEALKKQIQIETRLPLDLPDLWVDTQRLRQVLINLLSNAVKFTPEGGRITLEATHLPHSLTGEDRFSGIENFIRIAVTDTGIGIAPEHMPRLFQPFLQIDSSLARKYAGTGLGLSLVKRIVELHGGTVGLASEVGIGSCFTIDLPCDA